VRRLCSHNYECNDFNPCSEDVCRPDGSGEHSPTADDAYLAQYPEDCKELYCLNGKVEVRHDDDFPPDPCVAYACDSGTLTQTTRPNDEACTAGGGSGSCQAGECVVDCDADNALSVCDDDNRCTHDVCNLVTGLCEHTDRDNQEAPDSQAGDCQLLLCTSGAEHVVLTDDDVPDDGNDCTHPKSSPSAPGG